MKKQLSFERLLAALFVVVLTGCQWEPAGVDPEVVLDVPRAVPVNSTIYVCAWTVGWPDRARLEYEFSADAGATEGGGECAVFRAPGTADRVWIRVRVTDGDRVLRDSASVAVYEQVAILKADDLGLATSSAIHPNWQRFLAYVAGHDLRVGVGIVGLALDDGTPAFLDAVRSLASRPHVELWNHGYDHVLGATTSDGNTYSEFRGTTLEHQLTHLRRTQTLAREKLGVTLRAFGAPGNATDARTLTALAEVHELQVLFFMEPVEGKVALERLLNIENPLPAPNYDAFTGSYDPTLPYLALQIHPGAWGEDRLAEFRRIVEFLRDRDVVFMTPSEYLEAVRTWGTVVVTEPGP